MIIINFLKKINKYLDKILVKAKKRRIEQYKELTLLRKNKKNKSGKIIWRIKNKVKR